MGRQQYNTKKVIGKIIQFAQDGEYFFNKGIKFYRHRDLYKAKKYFQRAVHFDPKEPVFLCQLAIILAELGEFDESNAILIEVIEEIEPEMTECYYFLANNYAYLGLFQEAKKYAKLYLACAPGGEFYEDTEDLFDLLSIETNDLVGLDDDEDELIIKQENARQLLEAGKLEEASLLLQKLVNDYPEFWSAYNNLALAQFYLGNVDKAIKLTNDVLNKNEGNLHALCNLAVFYHYLGREKEVASLVKQLNVVYPIDMDQRSKLGVTYALIGNYEDAYKWLRWLQRYGYDGDVAFYYWLSISAYYTNQKQLAGEMWKKVIKLDPGKKGGEPWLKTHIQRDDRTGNQLLIEQFKNSNSEEEKLLIILLIMRSGSIHCLEELQAFILTNKQSLLVKEFISLMLNKLTNEKVNVSPRLAEGVGVIETLSNLCILPQEIEKKCYLLLFRVLINANDTSISFKNNQAWAAAIEYCCLRAGEFQVVQKQVADKYFISTSTLRKYVKVVSDLV